MPRRLGLSLCGCKGEPQDADSHNFLFILNLARVEQMVRGAAGAGCGPIGTAVLHAPPLGALPATVQPHARIRAPGYGSNGEREGVRVREKEHNTLMDK